MHDFDQPAFLSFKINCFHIKIQNHRKQWRSSNNKYVSSIKDTRSSYVRWRIEITKKVHANNVFRSISCLEKIHSLREFTYYTCGDMKIFTRWFLFLLVILCKWWFLAQFLQRSFPSLSFFSRSCLHTDARLQTDFLPHNKNIYYVHAYKTFELKKKSKLSLK